MGNAAGRSGVGPRWLLLVGLPIGGLLAVASLVPPDEGWAKATAQVAAIVVPLGIAAVLARWATARSREHAVGEFRERLVLTQQAPDGLRVGLDDPVYRIAPYWGRSATHRALNQARAAQCPGAILVTGPAWVGKSRLLIEWSLCLPEEVAAGWIRPGSAVAVIQEAESLGIAAVLLLQGDDAEVLEALAALSGSRAAITLMIERRDSSHLVRVARDSAPGAARLLESAVEVAVESPGRAADLEHRYGEMVVAYGTIAGTWESAPAPRSPHRWTIEPIGLVSALTMLRALEGPAGPAGLSPMQSFGQYWSALSGPWLRERPGPRYGLPPVSDVQLQTALTVEVLAGGDTALTLANLALFGKLGDHEVDQLAAWSRDVTSSSLRMT